ARTASPEWTGPGTPGSADWPRVLWFALRPPSPGAAALVALVGPRRARTPAPAPSPRVPVATAPAASLPLRSGRRREDGVHICGQQASPDGSRVLVRDPTGWVNHKRFRDAVETIINRHASARIVERRIRLTPALGDPPATGVPDIVVQH